MDNSARSKQGLLTLLITSIAITFHTPTALYAVRPSNVSILKIIDFKVHFFIKSRVILLARTYYHFGITVSTETPSKRST